MCRRHIPSLSNLEAAVELYISPYFAEAFSADAAK